LQTTPGAMQCPQLLAAPSLGVRMPVQKLRT
jgi:hypothetical protein